MRNNDQGIKERSNYREDYLKWTGRYPEMVVTNFGKEQSKKYEDIVSKFEELEIVDEAFAADGTRTPSSRAVVFKDDYDPEVFKAFWDEIFRLRKASTHFQSAW